jgi:hypothetical protein
LLRSSSMSDGGEREDSRGKRELHFRKSVVVINTERMTTPRTANERLG